jgi:hypothetical protein
MPIIPEAQAPPRKRRRWPTVLAGLLFPALLLATVIGGGLALLPQDRLLSYELGKHGTYLGRYSRADVGHVLSGGVVYPLAIGVRWRSESILVDRRWKSKGRLLTMGWRVVDYSLCYVTVAECYILHWW